MREVERILRGTGAKVDQLSLNELLEDLLDLICLLKGNCGYLRI